MLRSPGIQFRIFFHVHEGAVSKARFTPQFPGGLKEAGRESPPPGDLGVDFAGGLQEAGRKSPPWGI